MRWGSSLGALIVVNAAGVHCHWLVSADNLTGGAPGPVDASLDAVEDRSSPIADASAGDLPVEDSSSDADPCPPEGDYAPCSGLSWRGRCYWSPTDTLRIGEVDVLCAAEGGYIATFTCQEEWAAARALAGNDTAWIGGQRVGNSPWQWSSGEPFDFSAWSLGFPDEDAGHPCIVIDKFTLDWKNNVSCTATRQPFCERGPLAR